MDICLNNIVGRLHNSRIQSNLYKKRKELGCKDPGQQEIKFWNYMQPYGQQEFDLVGVRIDVNKELQEKYIIMSGMLR